MPNNPLLGLAVSQCAQLIAAYLDGQGGRSRAVSPEELERAAQENRPLLTEALSAVSPAGLATVRSTFGSLGADLRREHPGQGHPYMWVLQQACLSRAHAAHVQVIMRHLGWYKQQMDQALAWLFGS